MANRGIHEASSRDIVSEPRGSGEVQLYRSANHVTNFADSCFSRKPTVAPIEAAHRSVSIAHLAKVSLLAGRPLDWDPAIEPIPDDRGASALLERPYREPWASG